MKKVIFLLVVMLAISSSVIAAPSFSEYCQKQMDAQGVCPQDICSLVVVEASSEQSVCQPKRCDQIPIQDCPKQFCATMTNCRGEEICNFQMFDPPQCGNVSYAGQDVPCCDGLVRRCGVAFLDDTCDMYGDNSEYSLPICIPCGNGICNNFENVCNCPEDCWPQDQEEVRFYDGQLYDQEKTMQEIKNK